ncbi:MAG: serine hydrolase, partial [Saprospiraceae bacterium]|nr:serine hydrolase [Saprospiraceae bacterium]
MKYFISHRRKLNIIISFSLIVFLSFNPLFGQNNHQWMEYASVNEAGFSKEELDSVKHQFLQAGGAALLVISEGRVVLSEGDVGRRFMVHSIRKSFISALIGIEVKKGNLKLNSTLESMGIDDINPLTQDEKQATLKDLISARSGVYLPSAYAPQGMIDNLPERGSSLPGETWYYNNWDFNVLVTIYNKATGKDFFEDFKEKIADPIGMEDFRLEDAYYRIEKERSEHPAYLFNMSARDMARFGQLYLDNGKWNGKQIVPASWIDKSTSVKSDDLGSFGSRGGYGYLWWSTQTHQGKKMYYASGSGGHRIVVLPEDDMVIVTRANTYENRMMRGADVEKLIQSIIDAKEAKSNKNASLKSYKPEILTIEDPYT